MITDQAAGVQFRRSSVPRRSSVLKLHPFLDAKGLLRVGGRLNASLALSFEEKRPLIIQKETAISKLLAQHFHEGVHYQGQTRTLGALREAGFWITGASKIIRDTIHKCVTCRKLRGKSSQQLMGSLPPERVQPSPP